MAPARIALTIQHLASLCTAQRTRETSRLWRVRAARSGPLPYRAVVQICGVPVRPGGTSSALGTPCPVGNQTYPKEYQSQQDSCSFWAGIPAGPPAASTRPVPDCLRRSGGDKVQLAAVNLSRRRSAAVDEGRSAPRADRCQTRHCGRPQSTLGSVPAWQGLPDWEIWGVWLLTLLSLKFRFRPVETPCSGVVRRA